MCNIIFYTKPQKKNKIVLCIKRCTELYCTLWPSRWFLCTIVQFVPKLIPGADPGFQVRGGALKKIAPSGGRCENIFPRMLIKDYVQCVIIAIIIHGTRYTKHLKHWANYFFTFFSPVTIKHPKMALSGGKVSQLFFFTDKDFTKISPLEKGATL